MSYGPGTVLTEPGPHLIKFSHEPMRWVTLWLYFLNKKTDASKVTRSVISSEDI